MLQIPGLFIYLLFLYFTSKTDVSECQLVHSAETVTANKKAPTPSPSYSYFEVQ